MWRPHLFCLGSLLDARWQEVWPRHEKKSRERVTRAPVARIFFCHDRVTRQWLAFFFVDSGSGGPCCTLWHAASEPCQSQISTCQSDGSDLSPANLSCPGVYCVASK